MRFPLKSAHVPVESVIPVQSSNPAMIMSLKSRALTGKAKAKKNAALTSIQKGILNPLSSEFELQTCNERENFSIPEDIMPAILSLPMDSCRHFTPEHPKLWLRSRNG
jgi:hypothetical protein